MSAVVAVTRAETPVPVPMVTLSTPVMYWDSVSVLATVDVNRISSVPEVSIMPSVVV